MSSARSVSAGPSVKEAVRSCLPWGAIHDLCQDPGGNQMSNPEPLLEVCGG